MAKQSDKRLVKKLKEEVILDIDPETVFSDTRVWVKSSKDRGF